MGRKPNPETLARTETADQGAVDSAAAARNQLQQRSAVIAAEYAEGVAYERERVISEARLYMAHTAQAYFELGKRLIQIKENESHGDWTHLLQTRLRIEPRTARKAMQVVLKLTTALPNRPAPAVLELGWTKVVELIAEPEETLAALEDGGTVAGKTLSDLDAMSTRELREALAEERKRTAAKDRVIAKKDARLNEAIEREEMRRAGSADEREQLQLSELRDAGLRAEQSLQALVASVDEVMREPATEAAELAARQTIDYLVQRLADALLHRGISVDLMGERIDPQWAKQIADTAAKGSKRRG